MARSTSPPDDDPSSDGEPFELFYFRATDGVYRALAVALGDAHLAREATDEGMARAFARWSTVARHENPGGWVFRVGLNWATSWRRKLRRERVMPDDLLGPAAEVPDPAANAALESLGRVPVNQRAVVVCRFLFNMSTAETADSLRIAEGTVRSRLSRAVAVLRRDLNEGEQ